MLGTWRAVVRDRVAPDLASRRVAAACYVLTGRTAWIGRVLRRLGGSWISTPEPARGRVTLGEWIDFADVRVVDQYGGPGWSATGVDGTWTDGAEARVVLPVDVPSGVGVTVTFEGIPFCVGVSPHRRIDVRVNDHVVARLDFDGAAFVPGPIQVSVAGDVLRPGEPLELGFVVRRPVVPATLGLSSDPRRVGLRLHRLRIDVDA